MFQALRNRNIALLFSAQVVSVAGDLVLFVALPFWVYQLTGSAMATGFMFAALTIPQLLFSPLAGVFVDRVNRRQLMIASDVIRAALMLCYLFVNTADQVWIIYLLAFAESAVSQFFRPATMAVVPNLVNGEEELTRANALLGASWAVGQLAGPALGGVLVATFGPHGAALFDAGTYMISALFVMLMRVPDREQAVAKLNDVRHAISQINHELQEGVRVVLNRPILRVVFAAMGILFLSQGIINVLLIVIVNQIWHASATEFGWFISMEGVGGVLGTIIVGAVATRVSPKRLVIFGGVFAGLILLVIINQPSIYVAMALMVLASVGIVAFDVGLTTLIQLGSDDSNRGRVSGLMHTVMAAAQLISIAATSLLADQVGPVFMLSIAALLFSLGGLAAVFAPPTDPLPATNSTAVTQPAE